MMIQTVKNCLNNEKTIKKVLDWADDESLESFSDDNV